MQLWMVLLSMKHPSPMVDRVTVVQGLTLVQYSARREHL
jgi:hypothetical protein